MYTHTYTYNTGRAGRGAAGRPWPRRLHSPQLIFIHNYTNIAILYSYIIVQI